MTDISCLSNGNGNQQIDQVLKESSVENLVTEETKNMMNFSR